MEPDDVKEVESAESAERIVSPIYVPGAVRKAKTQKYVMKDGGVVLPIEFEYKPMTDLDQSKFADRMRKAVKVEEMRETAYFALSKYVLKAEIEGFEPADPKSWRAFTCGEIVEEMLAIIRGDGKAVPDDDLKN